MAMPGEIAWRVPAGPGAGRPACLCWWPRASWLCPAAWAACESARFAARCRERSTQARISLRRWLRACRFSTCAITYLRPASRKKARSGAQRNGLSVQSREGLNIGLAVTVRYRLDPNKLDSVQAHMPQPVDKELVPPVVASAWRELAPGIHRARDLLDQARGGARQSRRNHHPQAGRRRHPC